MNIEDEDRHFLPESPSAMTWITALPAQRRPSLRQF